MDQIFLLGLVITVTTIIFTKIFKIFPQNSSKFPLPPGNRGWPVIGETATFVSSPKKFILNRMKKYSPNVFQTSLAGETMAVLCGPAANKFIFSNEDKLVKFWLPNSIAKPLAQPDNYQRNSLSYKLAHEISHKFLKIDSTQQFVGTMDSMTKQHFDQFWVPFDQVKVYPLAKDFTFELSCRIFIDFSNPNPEFVQELRDPFFKFVEGIISTPLNIPGMPYYKALKASKIVQEKLFGIIKQRKQRKQGKQRKEQRNDDIDHDNRDLLGRLIMASDDHGTSVSKEDVVSFVIGFFFASFFTSCSTIASLVSFLSKHQDVYEKVLQEQLEIKKLKGEELLNWADVQKMKYSWNVICETMRLRPPSAGNFREVITDFDYSGFNIPKGWKVHWSPYTTHMNPEYFPDPEKFNPSRFEENVPAPFTFVPFGGGPRMCAGKDYARMETLVFLHNLVTKFKFKMVNPNEKVYNNPDHIPAEGLPIYLQLHATT